MNHVLPTLPAAIGLTYAKVYGSQTPDGQCGGCPHMHLTCTESYYVIAGCGAVEVLSVAGGFQRIALEPGKVVSFTAGVVHRLINDDGLEILMLAENSGLPELGDTVFTFPGSYLANPDAYRAAQMVHESEATENSALTLSDALQMRDLAVVGFKELVDAFKCDEVSGKRQLATFQSQALELVRPFVPQWRIVASGAQRAAAITRRNLQAIEGTDAGYLQEGQVVEICPPDLSRLHFARCGLMWPYLPEGATSFEAWSVLEQ